MFVFFLQNLGCEGLDREFGVVNPESEWNPNWPLQMRFSKPGVPRFTIFGSPAMKCDKISGKGKRKIIKLIDRFATDNQFWSKKFLRGWYQMTTNGQNNLVEGPENGWLGYYSLTQQHKTEHLQMSFADYIGQNAPVTFTDPKVNQGLL